MPSLLIYIHGFHSSGNSRKAQQLRTYVENYRPDIKIKTPQLPCLPRQAADFLSELISGAKDNYNIGCVGSSLGGYLALWLNQAYKIPTVLVNPTVRPYDLFDSFKGPQIHPYTGEEYILTNQHLEELRNLEVESINNPSSIWLLQQKGDEVLDYKQAVSKLSQCKQTVEEGGNHHFVGFNKHIEQIISFLKL